MPLPANVTRITIENPGIHWKPGPHVFLACHSIVPLQSHLFPIATLPDYNNMEFLVRAGKGRTGRFFRYTSRHDTVLGTGQVPPAKRDRAVFIDALYGIFRPLRQFDSIVLLTGGMGATFIIPYLRDIVAARKQESQQQVPKKRHVATEWVRFVWAIKLRAQLSWFQTQLQDVLTDVDKCRCMQPDVPREIKMSVYVTCDEMLESPAATTLDRTLCSQAVTPPAVATLKDPDEMGTIHKDDPVSVQPVSPTSSYQSSPPTTDCCCMTRVEDEDGITPEQDHHRCTCSGPAPISIPILDHNNKKPTTDTSIPPNA